MAQHAYTVSATPILFSFIYLISLTVGKRKMRHAGDITNMSFLASFYIDFAFLEWGGDGGGDGCRVRTKQTLTAHSLFEDTLS